MKEMVDKFFTDLQKKHFSEKKVFSFVTSKKFTIINGMCRELQHPFLAPLAAPAGTKTLSSLAVIYLYSPKFAVFLKKSKALPIMISIISCYGITEMYQSLAVSTYFQFPKASLLTQTISQLMCHTPGREECRTSN